MRRRALRREASQASSKRQLLSLSHTFAIQCRKLKRSQSFWFCPSPSPSQGAREPREQGVAKFSIYIAPGRAPRPRGVRPVRPAPVAVPRPGVWECAVTGEVERDFESAAQWVCGVAARGRARPRARAFGRKWMIFFF